MQENIAVRRICSFALAGNEYGMLGAYVHNELRPNLGKKACVLKLRSTKPVSPNAEMNQLADSLAMQILGNAPQFYQVTDISKEQLAKIKLEIKHQLRDKLKGKTESAQQQIITGKLKKYYEEYVLYNQILIQEQEDKLNRRTISEYINAVSNKHKLSIKPIEHCIWDFK